MNLVASDIKKTYFKYFAAAFGSTLIGSIYAVVDMAMVGDRKSTRLNSSHL